MSKRHEDDDLVNLWVTQFDLHLPKDHEFYVEWLLWFTRLPTDQIRSCDCLWKLAHDWIRARKRRRTAKQH